MKNIRHDIPYSYVPPNIFVIENLATKLCTDICNKIDNNIGTNIRGQIYISIISIWSPINTITIKQTYKIKTTQ